MQFTKMFTFSLNSINRSLKIIFLLACLIFLDTKFKVKSQSVLSFLFLSLLFVASYVFVMGGVIASLKDYVIFSKIDWGKFIYYCRVYFVRLLAIGALWKYLGLLFIWICTYFWIGIDFSLSKMKILSLAETICPISSRINYIGTFTGNFIIQLFLFTVLFVASKIIMDNPSLFQSVKGSISLLKKNVENVTLFIIIYSLFTTFLVLTYFWLADKGFLLKYTVTVLENPLFRNLLSFCFSFIIAYLLIYPILIFIRIWRYSNI
jgi:hypothetical protein